MTKQNMEKTLTDQLLFHMEEEDKDDTNPVITAVVQTPVTLDYGDVGGGEYTYTPEAIENAIKGLIGYQIEDEQHRGTGDKSFATIIDGGYCPEYGGYIKAEVFKPEYHDLMRNIAKNMENGIIPKKGFSTEVNVREANQLADDKYQITRMDYDGLIWTKRPRDSNTGICSVKLNKKTLPTPQRRNKMSDEKTVPFADYEALERRFKQLEKDYATGESAYTKLVEEYKKGKSKFKTLQEEVTDLKGQLEPIWEANEEARTDVLNKIVENAKEEDQKVLRKSLENQSKEELEVLLNSMAPAQKGAVRKPAKAEPTEEELTVDQVMKIMGRA